MECRLANQQTYNSNWIQSQLPSNCFAYNADILHIELAVIGSPSEGCNYLDLASGYRLAEQQHIVRTEHRLFTLLARKAFQFNYIRGRELLENHMPLLVASDLGCAVLLVMYISSDCGWLEISIWVLCSNWFLISIAYNYVGAWWNSNESSHLDFCCFLSNRVESGAAFYGSYPKFRCCW